MSKRTYIASISIFVLLLMAFSKIYSQSNSSFNLFSINDNSQFSGVDDVNKILNKAVFLSINKAELLRLSENKPLEISFEVPYDKGRFTKVTLQRMDILAPNAKIVERTADGNKEVTLNDIAVSYYGKVEGFPNSIVSVTFTKDNVTGLMVSDEDNYILGSLKDRDGNETDNYVLYKEKDLRASNNFHCATEDNLSSQAIEEMRNVIMKGLNDASPTDLYVAQIAIEMDYATYNIYGGSMQNTTNYALALMAASSAIYMKEVNVRFAIPYLRVWVTSDPYTGTTSSQLLNQFRAEWNTNQQSVQRTLAHFITRRSGNLGGIAWVGVLCSNIQGGNGYGFSNTDGTIQPLPTYSWDVMVVSHEIGHNFGSPHTHNCGWVGGPIDSCYAVEGGCYTGPVISRTGTIMSYCHLTSGGISLVYGFGPQPREVVRNGAESAPCMTVSTRELMVGYPNGGESFRTGNQRQIYWGTSLTGNVNIELSTNNGTSWITVANNFPAANRIYDWTVPYIASTTQAKLRIINSSNPSVGDTSDASFRIILSLNAFNITSPPTGTRLEVSSGNTNTQRFTWESAGTEPSIRYKFKIRKLSTTIDYSIESNNGGADVNADIRKSNLDSIAQTMGAGAGDSVRCSWRAWGYNGIDSSVSSNTFLVTLIRTTVGINVISSIVPDNFSLANNYPNPFNPSTNIKFDIAKSTIVKLTIYDSKGSEVKTLVNERLQPGSYEYSFDAGNLPSGAYFYRLSSQEFTETKRMVLIK